jgi:zinc protease
VTPQAGAKTFAPVDTNGSERGGRPIVAFLPHRIGAARVVSGSERGPVIGDDFILVPLPSADETEGFQIVFEASAAGG